MERDVSVYDIAEHADFVFSAGDVVVRVAKSENESETAEQGAGRPTPCVGQVRLCLSIQCHSLHVAGAAEILIGQSRFSWRKKCTVLMSMCMSSFLTGDCT